MLRKISTILILIFLAAAFSKAAVKVIIFPDGKRKYIKTYNINGKEYTKLPLIAKVLYPGASVDPKKGEIKKGSKMMKVANSSFFVLKENNTNIDVAQMLLPVIDYRNELMIPIDSYFLTLQTFREYSVEISRDMIKLSKFSQKDKFDPEPVRIAEDNGEPEDDIADDEFQELRPDEFILESEIIRKETYIDDSEESVSTSMLRPVRTGGEAPEYKNYPDTETAQIPEREDEISDDELQEVLDQTYISDTEPEDYEAENNEQESGSKDRMQFKKTKGDPMSEGFFDSSFELYDGIKGLRALKKQLKARNTDEDFIREADEKEIPPNVYTMPRGLKRTELEK